MILLIPICYSMCDLIKLSTTVTVAPCWLWTRGSMQPPSYVKLVETSRWRVLICYAYTQESAGAAE